MNNPVYLCLSVQEVSKIAMYVFWYDYVKPKYAEKARLYYIDTDSFIFYIKQKTLTQILQNMFKTRFDTSHYE